MGENISENSFSPEHFDAFRQRLVAEMELLESWFQGEKFCNEGLQAGLELEAWLTNPDGLPAPDNSQFLSTLGRDDVVPELSKFNFELNVTPQFLPGDGLGKMQQELQSTWRHCVSAAAEMNHRVASIGILPTIEDDMLCLENISPLKRYAALNEQVLRLRNGRPLTLMIDGEDGLRTTHQDLMLESAATSVQVHLRVPQASSVSYYNASLIVSPLTVALAANASLLFGKRLWQDTRIAVFEQAVDTAGPEPRVTFGKGYVQDSLFELFQLNFQRHRVLLPAEREGPPAKMPYVRMHNGTVWNWNRPLIGFESDGVPHLRIEHRPMSASPSMSDLFADAGFYFGLVHSLATRRPAVENQLGFEDLRANFYQAARNGLEAEVTWLDGHRYCIKHLLHDLLLDEAMEGLLELGLSTSLIETWHAILRGRVESGQNGATWQIRKFREYDGDLPRLLLEYLRLQSEGRPVHLWE